jgi:serine/threonine protein kinase
MKYCPSCKTVYPADFQCCPKDGSALGNSSELLPGMVIRDKYQILQLIGSGGMATVYQVRHLAFNEIRAIKLINSQLADGDQFNKRLRAEAVIARKLQHPNAVHVEDLDRTEDGRPFIVMEYVEGQNLRTVIRREGPLPALRSLRIAAQIVSALAAAHKLGIIHRDIKPDNVHLIPLPDGADFVKVLDFGIAKFTQGMSSSAPRTGSGLVVGTPQYVSPEQAMGKQGGELDGRSDLYTLGIVLYEMLTGRVPFDSDTPVGLLVHHLHTTPVPPNELRPDLGIPQSVSEVLMKALEKNPEQRFRNADEMLKAIILLQDQILRAQQAETVETENASIHELEENLRQPVQSATGISAATPIVEETVRPGQERRPDTTEAPQTKSIPSSSELPMAVPVLEMPDPQVPLLQVSDQEELPRPAERPEPVATKAADEYPAPLSSNAMEMLSPAASVEQQLQSVELPGTIFIKVPEIVRDKTEVLKEASPKGVFPAFDPPREVLPALQDSTENWGPPAPPIKTMWPREGPKSYAVYGAATGKPWLSRSMLFIAMAVFGVVFLTSVGIYKWRSASARHAESRAQGLQDQGQRLPVAAAPVLGQSGTTGQSNGSVANHGSSSLAPLNHAPTASDSGVPSIPASVDAKKIAAVKDLVSQGRSLSDNGDYAEAMEKFDSALKLDPQNSEAKAGKRRAKERMQLEQALPAESR